MTLLAGATRPSTKTLLDVIAFADAMVSSRDLDPLYPVLSSLYGLMGLDEERRLWFTTLYLAYYNLPTALAAFRAVPTGAPHRADLSAAHLPLGPTGIERRGMRGGKVVPHLRDYAMKVGPHGSQHNLLTCGWMADSIELIDSPTGGWVSVPVIDEDDARYNYEWFWNTAQGIHGNGRWAAFKWAELLKEVHGYPLAAPDMRMQFCSGPKAGLCWLYSVPTSAPVEELNDLGADLRGLLKPAGVSLSWEELETVLCNFNSLRLGRYYVGHDIDELDERIESARESGLLAAEDIALLYLARKAALPDEYLGEVHGWRGIQKGRMSAYRDLAIVLTR